MTGSAVPPSISPPDFSGADRANMQTALSLAGRGLGRVWPNPSVGCVLVRGGAVVGRGWTQAGGRPHAETVALASAGGNALGADAYVTLEPCNHHGRTPPCTEALIAAGVRRVVVACEDPDPRVLGAGVAHMREAGIQVDVGLLAEEARRLNEGFFLRINDGRPLVTLKLATSLDGRIATRSGESQWITGPVARSWGHGLRARHDAIVVGIGTVLADDPELTCRLDGLAERSPVRVVIDSRLQIPLTGRLLRTAPQVPTWVVTLADGDDERRRAVEDCGATVIEVAATADGMPIGGVLQELGRRGLTRVLVEGGSRLAASLLQHSLVDRLEWFRATSVIGGDGIPAAAGFGLEILADARRFVRISSRQAGEDSLDSYRRR